MMLADDENEDWIKTQTWDLPWTLPEHADAMIEALGAATIRKLLDGTLPAGRPMPPKLRTALEAKL